MNKIIDGKTIAEKIIKELKEKIIQLSLFPKLVVIQIGEDEASNVYIENKKRACEETEINFELIKFDDSTEEKVIKDKILELNKDKGVHGIIIQLSSTNRLKVKKLIDFIDPLKDVDGLTTINIGKLINNLECNIPCTALGILKLLDIYQINIEGKHIVILGRSNLVGKPLFNLLLNRNATVTICHSKTLEIEKYTKQADILIVAIGKGHFITKEMIKENAILIDVGINRIDNKIIGDINFDDVYEKCLLITPVPNGVGPMTVAMLLNNVVNAYQQLKKTDL